MWRDSLVGRAKAVREGLSTWKAFMDAAKSTFDFLEAHPFGFAFTISFLLLLAGYEVLLHEQKVLNLPWELLVTEFPPPDFWLWQFASITFWVGIAGTILAPVTFILSKLVRLKKHRR